MLRGEAASDSGGGGGGGLRAFAELERANWQIATDTYDDGFGPLTRQAIPSLLRHAGFPPPPLLSGGGTKARFLDVATGPGYVVSSAMAAAEEAGLAGGSVEYAALDFSPNFLSLASARLGDLHPGVPVTLVEGDACAMPFDDGGGGRGGGESGGSGAASGFDSVACNFGILHLPDPDAFLREGARVLAPGGRLSFSAWAAPPRTWAFELVMGSVEAVGNPKVQLPEGPPFFRFGDPAECDRSLRAAGFADVEVTVVHEMEWDNVKNAEQLYSIFLEGTARTRELLLRQTAEETERIKDELRRRFEEKTQGGTRALRMPAVVASGCKPTSQG